MKSLQFSTVKKKKKFKLEYAKKNACAFKWQ